MSADWNVSHIRGSHPSVEEQFTMKNYLAPNDSTAKVEKPWCKGRNAKTWHVENTGFEPHECYSHSCPCYVPKRIRKLFLSLAEELFN